MADDHTSYAVGPDRGTPFVGLRDLGDLGSKFAVSQTAQIPQTNSFFWTFVN
jgi:hypothetical protein